MFAAKLPEGRATWMWRVQGGGSRKGALLRARFSQVSNLELPSWIEGMNDSQTNSTGAAVRPDLTQSPAWQALAAHHSSVRDTRLRNLFAEDPQRGERFTAEAAGL